MLSIRPSLLALGCVFACACTSPRHEPTPEPAPSAEAVAPTRCQALRGALRQALESAPRRSPDALLAVDVEGCEPLLLSTGRSHLDVSTPFRMASVAKTFVATLLLRAVAARKLSLDAPLTALLPGLPEARGQTARTLASHTSGLFSYEKDDLFRTWQHEPPAPRSPTELLALSRRHPRSGKPGERYHYANTNYVLLGLALEALSRRPLAEQISSELTGPLGLRSMHAERTDIHEPLMPSFDAEGRETTWSHHPSWLFGAGDLVTNLEDLVRWTRLWGTGSLVPDGLRGDWLRPVPTQEEGVAYGLGLFQSDLEASGGNGPARTHAGAAAGLHLQAVYFMAKNAAVVAVVNQDGGDPDAVVLAAASVLSGR